MKETSDVECKHCDDFIKKSNHLVEILHNPISPYYSSSYNGIISIVCGITLSFVLTEVYSFISSISLINDKCFLTIWGYAIIIIIIGIIWHSYIKLTQYKAWPLDAFDTFIPILFSINIYLLMFFVHDIKFFTLLFSILCFVGSWAYNRTVMRMEKNESKLLYKFHYSKYSDNVGICIYNKTYYYERYFFKFYRYISIIFMLFAVLEFMFYSNNTSYGLDFYIIYFFMSATCVYTFFYDINHELKKMKCLSVFY